MSPDEFVIRLQQAWEKPMKTEAAMIYADKVQRFTYQQLDAIFDRLLENCKYQPRIADIYSAATDLELLAKPSADGSKSHEWVKTDCRLCEGEGRLNVIMQRLYIKNATELRKETHFIDLRPYSDARWIGYTWGEGYYSYVFRCSCPAGEVETIPKAWPRWNPDRHRRSEPARPAVEPETVGVFRPLAKVVRMFSEEVPF